MEINDRIFLTGASGFLGSLVAHLISECHPETYLRLLQHRLPLPQLSTRFHVVHGSLLQNNLGELVSDIDTIIHCAALTKTSNLQDYWRVNVEGMQNLIHAALDTKVKRIIFISSRSIGAECGYYGTSKLAAENILIQSGIPYTILRFAEVYGRTSNEGINKLIRLVRTLPLILYPAGDIRFAPLWQDDAAGAIINALHIPSTNTVYTLGGPLEYTFPELIRTIADYYSLQRMSVAIPQKIIRLISGAAQFMKVPIMHPDQLQRMMCQKKYDNTIANKDLHFSPISLDKGLSLL